MFKSERALVTLLKSTPDRRTPAAFPRCLSLDALLLSLLLLAFDFLLGSLLFVQPDRFHGSDSGRRIQPL